MSSLNLPKMTFNNLDALLGTRWRKQIAYATTAERVADTMIYVKHHENVIAVIEHDRVYITNAGWESSTTTTRLMRVLRDNGIPWMVRIQNFRHVISRNYAPDPVPFRDATFTRIDGTWINAEEMLGA